eukprot:Sspe_Gene.82890::Locus_54348_Transcript_1_1_Confidence_1.000_Length_1934::g.82890::m.82890
MSGQRRMPSVSSPDALVDDPAPFNHSIVSQWQVILQLGITYLIAIFWFKDGVTGVWGDILQNKYTAFAFLEDHGLVPTEPFPDEERWPTVLATAAIHTALALVGVVLGNTLKRLRSVKTGFVLGMATTLLFGLTNFVLMRTCFDSRAGGVVHMAKGFHFPVDIPNASLYFAAISSVSMMMWVAIPMGLAALDTRDEGIAPAVIARYLPRIVGFYVMSLVFFRFCCVPLWNTLARHSVLASGASVEIEESRITADLDHLAKLASVTHTLTLVLGIILCSVANRTLRALPCSAPRQDAIRVTIWNTGVFIALVVTFCVIMCNWVYYALLYRVQHVVAFAQIFAGEEATVAATEGGWSQVHTLVLTSYASWFAFGVLFEQTWLQSATNVGTRSIEDRVNPTPWVSATVVCALVVMVVIPMAWTSGVVGLLVLAVLLQPAPRQSRSALRRPVAPPDAYKKVDWKKATADCPKTGDQYLIIGVGFVGVRLVERLLERGETRIRAMDLLPVSPFKDHRVQYIRGDVTSKADLERACRGVDTVITTFALIRFFERMDFQAAASIRVNIDGTRNVIEACRKAGVKRLVQTSTSNVMATPALIKGDAAHNMDETRPYVTREISHNHYSWTK